MSSIIISIEIPSKGWFFFLPDCEQIGSIPATAVVVVRADIHVSLLLDEDRAKDRPCWTKRGTHLNKDEKTERKN